MGRYKTRLCVWCVCVCVRVCASWCVCRWQGNAAAYFVCGLPISDSAEHSPSMRQIYICCGSNNLKPIVMLTLVYTRIHIALPHDYICVALNKMTYLTLSNNSGVIVAHECEIVFCRQLVHCHGSNTHKRQPMFVLWITLPNTHINIWYEVYDQWLYTIIVLLEMRDLNAEYCNWKDGLQKP